MIPLTNRWAVLALMFLVGLNLPMQFQAVTALAPFLVAEAGLGYTDIGVLTGLYMFPGIFLAAPSGLLAAAVGDRMTLALGVALMTAAALVFVLSDSYAVMFASRLVGGAGGVVITVFLPKIVADWFAGKEIATAQSIIASSFGLGVGLALAILPPIASLASWKGAMLANAGVGVLAIVLLLALYRDHASGGARGAAAAPSRINQHEVVLSALAGLGRGLFASGYVVFMGFAPALLIARGMATTEAGLLTSLAAAVSLASVPLGGYLSDKLRRPNLFIVVGALGTAASCALIPEIAPALPWVLLFGLMRGGCTGGIMSLPVQVLRPESRRAGFAFASSMYFVCMAGFPAIAGYLLDMTAKPEIPLWFAAALWLAIIAQLGSFKLLQRRWIPRRA